MSRANVARARRTAHLACSTASAKAIRIHDTAVQVLHMGVARVSGAGELQYSLGLDIQQAGQLQAAENALLTSALVVRGLN